MTLKYTLAEWVKLVAYIERPDVQADLRALDLELEADNDKHTLRIKQKNPFAYRQGVRILGTNL